MSISMRDIGWTAGFLEGEGSFTLAGLDPRVQATQVNMEPLDKLTALFGGVTYPKKTAGFGKQPVHSWVLTSMKAIGLMLTIFPLMSQRRQEQILKVASAWKSRSAFRGARHWSVTVSDEEALEAMKCVLLGGTMTDVARYTGISRITISTWLHGEVRPYLLERLPLSLRARLPQRKVPVLTSDADALEALRRVAAGEPVAYVARSLGIHHATIWGWIKGDRKPHLRAQLTLPGGV